MDRLFIGNKPYNNLNLGRLIDSFDNNVRFNMGVPAGHNGTIKDQIVICNHMYKYFASGKKISLKRVLEIYDSMHYDPNYIEWFYNTFKVSDYTELIQGVNYQHVSKANDILKLLDCPFKFIRRPRCGIGYILHQIQKRQNESVFAVGFTMNHDELRQSYYTTKYNTMQEEFNKTGHSKTEEIQIIRWLHETKKIDATFCLLEDKNNPVIKRNGLEPTEKSVEILKSIYKNVDIKE